MDVSQVDACCAPAVALSIETLLLTLSTRLQRWFTAIAIATALLLITAKVVLAGMLVTSSIGTALCLIAAISANVSRKRRRASAQRENPVSGLPNFEALRSQPPFGSATVIAEIGRASCRERVCPYV